MDDGLCTMTAARVSPTSFPDLVEIVRRRVDDRLANWLAPRVEAAAAVSEEAGAVAEAVRDLALRGGKRLRAALVVAGFEAFSGGVAALPACDPATLAVELLQTYLLIHDDWMDADDVRRGGPAVHVLLKRRLGDRIGDAAAVLAGDLASGYAQEALLESDVAPARLLRASRVFARTQVDVVIGQVAEMRSSQRSGAVPSVETVHALKTASYTVIGPLLLGAALAGADDARCAALSRFGRTLGIAFQLRDDLLGTFGDPRTTGKPVGNDLRRRKRTALTAELERDGSSHALLVRLTDHASADEVDAVLRLLTESGARARVEARIGQLCSEALAVLADMDVSAAGRGWLTGAVAALGERSA
jgi:geranylgeranyl diphosphate synthase, type I